MIRFFDRLKAFLLDQITWLWDKFIKFVYDIYDFFLGAERGWLWWIIGQVVDYAIYAFDMLMAYSPATLLSTVTEQAVIFYDAIAFANMFFPVTETLLMLSFLLYFVAIFLVIKVVAKAIPTVG
jgi:hypothetical protein